MGKKASFQDLQLLGFATQKAAVKTQNTVQIKQEKTIMPSAPPKPEKLRNVFVDIALDGTISCAEIYPAIYDTVRRMAYEMQEKSHGVQIYFGLTVFRTDAQQILSNGSQFTADIRTFLQTMNTIEFYGGSEDGYEDGIYAGMHTALTVLAEQSEPYDARGLVVFSDSCPHKAQAAQGDFINAPADLRFAALFLYNTQCTPSFRMTDHRGNQTEAQQYQQYCIRVLQEESGRQTAAQELARTMLSQLSSQ